MGSQLQVLGFSQLKIYTPKPRKEEPGLKDFKEILATQPALIRFRFLDAPTLNLLSDSLMLQPYIERRLT